MKLEKPIYIYFRESLLQSVIADTVTFGYLAALVYLSRHDTLWIIICILMFLIYLRGMLSIKTDKTKKFTSEFDLYNFAVEELNKKRINDN